MAVNEVPTQNPIHETQALNRGRVRVRVGRIPLIRAGMTYNVVSDVESGTPGLVAVVEVIEVVIRADQETIVVDHVAPVDRIHSNSAVALIESVAGSAVDS